MTLNDTVQASFEMAASVLIWFNVRALLRDKVVRGVWWPASLFFLAWGIWGLIFYVRLGLGLSVWCLAVRMVGYCTWLALLLYYWRKGKR